MASAPGILRAVIRTLTLLLAACLASHAPMSAAATFTVGPEGVPMGFAEALRQARNGDVIEVLPGTYKGAVAAIEQTLLTIRGVGERPVFDAGGQHAEGKAIWIVRNGDITIENIEFRGARVPDANGAGIRFERGRLTINRCRFVDNQNGLLTANFTDAELRITDSEFLQAVRQGLGARDY